MIKILFVCLGNICRSPMAECIMTDIVKKHGLQSEFRIASAATSCEEEGNPIYPPARRKLNEKGVEVLPHCATLLTRDDKNAYDLIIAMEERNVRAIYRIIGESDKFPLVRATSQTHGGQVISKRRITISSRGVMLFSIIA